MIRKVGKAFLLVNGIVGVEAAVAVELERRAVKQVGAGFCDHVDDSAAGMTEFRRIGVGIHLEFLHGVLAELIGSAAGTGAAERLAEKRIVVV